MKTLITLLALLISGNALAAPYLPFYLPTAQSNVQSRDAVVAACVADPTLGTVYYYCDCGTGADGGCVAGNDANAGTSPSTPRRTVTNALDGWASRLANISGNNTIAFCKGGAFDASAQLQLQPQSCASGQTCTQIREYASPIFTSSAKPIFNSATASALFRLDGTYSGIKFENIKMIGDGIALYGSYNVGLFTYGTITDITMCNVDMVNFGLGIDLAGNVATPDRIKLTGNTYTNNYQDAIFGSANNLAITYNNFEGNGTTAVNGLTHALYLGGAMNNVTIQGNYFHGIHSSGSLCYGSMMSEHMYVTNLLVKNNIVNIDPAQATPACWGFEFSNIDNYPNPSSYQNAVFDGNIVINGGNHGIVVTTCPSCVIQNNVVIQDWAANGGTGINITNNAANTGRGDLIGNAYHVINNTVWFGPNFTGTAVGIRTDTEGTGHVIANNSISSVQGSGTLHCFRHDIALTSYSFMDNNGCYSTGSYDFENTYGSLANWITHTTAYGFDAHSITTSTNFVNQSSNYLTGNFKPNTGSGLIGAGNNTNKSTYDFAGVARPNPPDIGAYQH